MTVQSSTIRKTLGWLTVAGLGTAALIRRRQRDDNEKIDSEIVTTIHAEASTSVDFRPAIESARKRLEQWRTAQTIPGLVVGVSVSGQTVWIEGNGLADIENGLPCHPDTVMRIASISKSITGTLLAKMVQDKKIGLDDSIYKYLTDGQFPKKEWQGEPVDITVRQLASHLGGIRHYREKGKKDEKENTGPVPDSNLEEFYIQKKFSNITESLSLFKDDPLVAKPGTKFVYTTFGYTLLSAVMETQMEKKDFVKGLKNFLHNELGMKKTILDENDPIILNRTRHYNRHQGKGFICNVPFVDNSCKWAGGGLLSTVPDLLRFGNILLYSFIGHDHLGHPGYFDRSIVDEMWRPLPNTGRNNNSNNNPITDGYGLGFFVIRDGKRHMKAFASEPPFDNLALHTGGAVGASSVLIIQPENEIVVAILVNLQEASGIHDMGLQIAKLFADRKKTN